MGPTASGKSAVALALARGMGDVELVSVDSMQVYRGMDIGTAKPSAEERAEIPHHLLDLVDPTDDFSVTRFQAEAARVLAEIESRGHRALLVGGTGLYLQAVVDRLMPPGSWPAVRERLEEEAATPDGVRRLYGRLREADPEAATKIDAGNSRRIVRALEVILGSGRPFSSFGPGLTAFPPTSFRLAGLWLPRPVVAARIEARYTAQLEAGFLEEVEALVAGTVRLSRTARQALGYRELLDHLAGKCSLNEAVEQAVQRTRAFARRQRMWFRRDPRIVWFGSSGNPFVVLPALLEHWAH